VVKAVGLAALGRDQRVYLIESLASLLVALGVGGEGNVCSLVIEVLGLVLQTGELGFEVGEHFDCGFEVCGHFISSSLVLGVKGRRPRGRWRSTTGSPGSAAARSAASALTRACSSSCGEAG
jgi:hypothetical protein